MRTLVLETEDEEGDGKKSERDGHEGQNAEDYDEENAEAASAAGG